LQKLQKCIDILIKSVYNTQCKVDKPNKQILGVIGL
jgi:hypothetical protein